MTDDELKKLVADLAICQKETNQQIKELFTSRKEMRQESKEFTASQQENDRMIKELGKQIGGLGNKFGGFTEGMALPSMTRILQERFGVEVISPRVQVRHGSDIMELDVLAYANDTINADVGRVSVA